VEVVNWSGAGSHGRYGTFARLLHGTLGPIVVQIPTSAPSPGSLPARTRAAAGLGGLVAAASRRLGRGGGSVIGGRAILAVDPRALQRLAAGRTLVLVSGTNGKTTTTSLIRAALSTSGPVVTNLMGANLPPGLASALAEDGQERGVLEVDEAWLGRVVDATGPRAVALLNLSRDQLDRNNEVRRLATSWRDTFAAHPGVTVVANADDPLVVWGAMPATDVRWVAAGQPWTEDAAGCPKCGGRVDFTGSGDGSGDGWRCRSCDLRRPEPDVRISGGAVVARDGTRIPLNLSLPGRANQANAAIALTVASVLDADAEAAAAAIGRLAEIEGRYAVVRVGAEEARLLLAKNPAGWLEVFDFLRPAPVPVVVAINARIADGRDPSWLWDVPFERLEGRLVVATGERSRDLAVRLRYAGVQHVREADLVRSISAAGASSVDVVANYTSFQQLRARLA
jgi:lipid II isoglutaminyl synthase (glutamine-hydrolysing)